MLGTIKLNTIKNKINDFALKSCVYISPKDKDYGDFDPYCYQTNEAPFYILCTDKRKAAYISYSYSPFVNRNSTGIYKNKIVDDCDFGNYQLQMHNITLDKFLIIQQNKDFMGWYPSNNLIDNSIEVLKGNKYCKHHKDNIYYGNNTYNIDTNKLCVFVRIIPHNNNDLTNMLFSCTRDNIYNISDRSDINTIRTLGFIVELRDRHKFYTSKTYKKVTKLLYPFITKKRINELIFDSINCNYKLQTHLLLINDNTNLDKYGIKMLSDF